MNTFEDCYSLTGEQHDRIVESGRAALKDALERIREVVSKRQLPITNQVYEIADSALKASAIEARRATTPQSDAVHESAVGEAETPEPSDPRDPDNG